MRAHLAMMGGLMLMVGALGAGPALAEAGEVLPETSSQEVACICILGICICPVEFATTDRPLFPRS